MNETSGWILHVFQVAVAVVPHMHATEQHMVSSSSPPVSAGPAAGTVPAPIVTSSIQQHQQQQRTTNACIRHGCPNAAISNAEWEDEYCSNECVVNHCRDVFSTWVASNQSQQNFSAVK